MKLFMINWNPFFGQENFQLNNVDTGGMILSMKTQNIFKNSSFLEDVLDFSSLDKNHELFNNKHK